MRSNHNPPQPVTCPTCSVIFYTYKRDQRFCSLECKRREPVDARLHKKTNRNSGVIRYNLTECWEWTGSTGSHGYGTIYGDGRYWLTHRLAWFLIYGEDPDVHVLHKCDNRKCVNPDHLFLGTDADNVRDMCAKGRRVQADLRGDQSHFAKLTRAEVLGIREAYSGGAAVQQLAAKYSVSRDTVSRIVHRKSWANV